MSSSISLRWIWFTAVVLLIGCSRDDYRVALFHGDWKVEDLTTGTRNGEFSYQIKRDYRIEFTDDNFGTKYALEGEDDKMIKWAFQDESDEDKFMLSTQVVSNLGTSSFSFNTIYNVEKLKEEEIHLRRERTQVSNDTTFVTSWELIFTKE